MINEQLKSFEKIVTYYAVKEGRNKGIIVAYGDWPLRSVRHNGWGLPITSRLMVEDEIEYEKTYCRYHFDKYGTVASLLADEQKIVPEDIYNKLKECFVKFFEIDLTKMEPKCIQRRLFVY